MAANAAHRPRLLAVIVVLLYLQPSIFILLLLIRAFIIAEHYLRRVQVYLVLKSGGTGPP
jgi:hypothetical protein